ncbi:MULTISPECIES: DUF3168 domain-containing protein [unclassified Novosphingobium]|uniref:DUF3168 domain-containing protein n=1 Tax=unclassified Novosphingobium TaxID=2644732 RepID=UPI00020EF1EE|nr:MULTISPECIES: DUF3168 domain-containing protein [unclassified Novosphingobium]GFM27896.1 putative uncharacterized protein [Novosphingobium sp. PY1]CCA94276.1 conserved hypothetical protein [Novosphingobium sp. PP1Y]
MEVPLRAALLDWLAADAALAEQLNAIVEEAPLRTSLPWLAIAASASIDWSTKTASGREVRVALELHCRGDRPDAAATLVTAIEARIEAMPREQSGFSIVSARFLRARAEQRTESRRAILLEYRFRLLSQ